MSYVEKIKGTAARYEKVDVQGVGDVNIKHLSSDQVYEISELADKKQGTYALVAAGVLDEEGKPVFASRDEVGADTDWQVVKNLAAAVAKANGMSAEAEEKNPQAPNSSTAEQQS